MAKLRAQDFRPKEPFEILLRPALIESIQYAAKNLKDSYTGKETEPAFLVEDVLEQTFKSVGKERKTRKKRQKQMQQPQVQHMAVPA